MDRRVWPFDWGFVNAKGPTIPLKSRVHPKSQILPCAVAKYGSPQDISRSLLESKGLFMKIMQQADDSDNSWFFRWISPFEQMASMGFPAGTLIPNNKASAFQVVGNAISVAHSIISLLRIQALLPQTFLESGKTILFDALIEMRTNIGRLPKMHLCGDDEYLWLSPTMEPSSGLNLHSQHWDSIANSPVTQQEVDAIAELLKKEDDGNNDETRVIPKLRRQAPDAPILFMPVDHSELQGEVIYATRTIAMCVTQLTFSTITRDKVMHDCSQVGDDVATPSVDVHLQTFDGTWIWKGHTQTPCVTVGVLIRTALPHATSSLLSSLVLNGSHCDWNFTIEIINFTQITIAFQTRFVAKLVHIIPGDSVTPVLCDMCDTPDTISQAVCDNYQDVKHSLIMTSGEHTIEADQFILAEQSSHFTIRISKGTSDSRIGAIHPINGKYHEVLVPKSYTLRDLCKMIAPEIGDRVQVIAEINHQRVAIDTPISNIDLCNVVRFRCFPLRGGAKGEARSDFRSQLREQLLSHGVPENAVAARIHAVTSVIPEARLIECFGQSDVWAALKNLCTAANVRMVLPQELKERQTTLRATPKNGDMRLKAKGKGKGKALSESSKHAPLLPPMVENVDFHNDFQGPDGIALPIIYPSAMCTNGTGVCPMNLTQAKSFLPVSIISPDPLAILILGHHDTLSDHKITVAGTLKTTNMPCLLPATLLQFGASEVQYKFTGLKVEVTATDSQILEVIISKDRCQHWDTNIAPIDIMAKSIPSIKEKTIMIGTWGWKSLDQQWKQTHASSAQVWRGYIRIIQRAVDAMLKSSGPGGISLWPKDSEYRPNQEYVHLAVTAANETQAQACTQKVPQHLGFVHHRGRFLIRCLRIHFNAVKKTLNPEGCILDACDINPDDLRFVLTGLTEGFTAESITEGLKKAGWNARTVRALSAKTWLLVASQPPENKHLAINGNLATVRPFQRDAPLRQFDAQPRNQNTMAFSSWNDDQNSHHPLARDPWQQSWMRSLPNWTKQLNRLGHLLSESNSCQTAKMTMSSMLTKSF